MSIKVAIVGVGNCASSLIQGIEYYKKIKDNKQLIPGLMHNVLGDYKIKDIEIVTAFDIDKRKIGKDVSQAIFSEPNCTKRFAVVPKKEVTVKKGPVLDGIASTTKNFFLVDKKQKPVNVSKELKKSNAEILINYLPVGSEKASMFYAKQAIKAGCAFINAIPVFIASNPKRAVLFKKKGLPIIGDDIKSQVGATIVHRALTKLFSDRGVKIDCTYQLNFGGNTDFLNMLERKRLYSKKKSKTQSVQAMLSKKLLEKDIHIGPSDYVPFMKDKKVCYIRIEGRKFGDVPVTLELRLEVEDSPNSAGVIIDAIRCAKIGLDKKLSGPLIGPSAYFMKSPPKQYRDEKAKELVEEFIKQE